MAVQFDATPAGGFFAARWRGAVSLERIFFLDMLLVATILNLATCFASLMAFGFKAPAWAALAIYLAPLPYNIFLMLCVWRATERTRGAGASAYRLAALGWLLVATLI